MEPRGPPPPSLLESLPVHILEYICQHLSRHCLYSLSLANRSCYHATISQRFSRIRFSLRTKDKLQDDVQQWIALLDRGDRFRHVRRVVLAGQLLKILDGSGDAQRKRSWQQDDDWDLRSDGEGDSDSDMMESRFGSRYPRWVPLNDQDELDVWLPLTQFLARLPGLTDFFYASAPRIPACVLHALHEHHPRSRLHVSSFTLSSLYQDADKRHNMSPDDRLLATSPCLYSIHMRYQARIFGRDNFNMEALERMVCGHAPRLKRVSVVYLSLPGREEILCPPGLPRDDVLGIGTPQNSVPTDSPQQSPIKGRRARLESLVLSYRFSEPYVLEAWNNWIDFGALRRLAIHCRNLTPQFLAALTAMAASGAFRSIRELALTLAPDNEMENPTTFVDKPASLFLKEAPPLEVLQLRGNFGKHTLEAALGHHGGAVRRLLQEPSWRDYDMILDGNNGYVLGQEHIRELQQRCPRIEEVTLRVPRRWGRPDEVAMYRELGRLAHLRRLCLVIDCSPQPVGGVGGSDTIRGIIANAAIDEALARAIFNEITSAANAPLERLWLATHSRSGYDPERDGDTDSDSEASDYHYDEEAVPELDRVLGWVGKSWICARDGPGGVLRVNEAGRIPWEGIIRQKRAALEAVGQVYKDAWNELWPRSAEGGDWLDGWKSLPLIRVGAVSPE